MAPYKREIESQAPEPPAAISTIDLKNAFGGCDLELFRSGDHADVRIICEGRDFLAHKAVLASRSTWFQEKLAELNQVCSASWARHKKVMLTRSQQPQPAEVLANLQVTSHKASDLELVLVFIYAGGT